MSLKKYFEREYNFLQLEGERFAERHQGLAAELKLAERQRKDPFVERLFEAFAFLAGRIHERLDDDFPEITGGLLEILFPHLIRPFPSCAILEAKPIPNILAKPTLLPRGSEVQTPTGKYQVKYKVAAGPQERDRTIEKTEPTEFIFRTTNPMVVRPMQLKEVRVEDQPDGTSALILQIHPHRGVSYEALDLGRLSLYLHGPDSLKYTLWLYLVRHAVSLSVREIADRSAEFRDIKAFRIGVSGLPDAPEEAPEEYALIPYARQIFTGYRLLQEYFSFRERFFFIDIEGLNEFPAASDGAPFEIKIRFDRKLSSEYRPSAKNILLHCVPIINLFDRPTEEVIVNQLLPEYYVLPDRDRRKSREIYSLNRIRGVSENQQQIYKYLPVTSYDILDPADPEFDYKRFFSVVLKPLPGDMGDAYLRLFGPSLEDEVFAKETLSIEEATLSNGFLPAKYLGLGTLTQPVSMPSGIEVANLTVPSETLPCPDRQNFLWTIIAQLTLSYSSLAEQDVLKSVLSLYNWSPEHTNPNRKKIQAIKKIHPPRPRYFLKDQALIRGIEFKIEIDPALFENGEGDIEMFGAILSRFLSQYVTVNSFVVLTMTELGTNRAYTWQPKLGKIAPV